VQRAGKVTKKLSTSGKNKKAIINLCRKAENVTCVHWRLRVQAAEK